MNIHSLNSLGRTVGYTFSLHVEHMQINISQGEKNIQFVTLLRWDFDLKILAQFIFEFVLNVVPWT